MIKYHFTMDFKLAAPFVPTGDQPQAIDTLVKGLKNNLKHQVLLGVTGSGKTYTMAQVIARMNKPTLVISHNKTLAAQLYQEFKQFFPQNAVCYFVSYYDFYKPEAYLPQTDTYIEKETEINEEIDKLRLASTTNLLTRRDTLIVASVSCIYNLGNPRQYGKFILELRTGEPINRQSIIERLVDLQYERSEFSFHRSTFRLRAEFIDVYLAYESFVLRIVNDLGKIKNLQKIDPLTGKLIEEYDYFAIYPAKHYLTDLSSQQSIFDQISRDLEISVAEFRQKGKLVEAHRLNQRVNFDLEMIKEMGYVNGIENYSRYFDGRSPGDPPYSLIDYYTDPYKDNWLMFIDESHMTVPQLRGMYNGDRSRKETLIDYGFRLPAALDNRPLKFEEFFIRIPQLIYVSATPNVWEINLAKNSAKKVNSPLSGIAEQLVRPTGILDPIISVRPTKNQLIDLIHEIIKRKKNHQRVLVTTLTKRMAEDLAKFLEEQKYKQLPEFKNIAECDIPRVSYLHSDIVTLERSDILDDLRQGKYDCLIGINLLREGLDLPEVSLVAILDADKEGFLRSETALIQTMGRAARHIKGEVIMYADTLTGSMTRAISEINRRRKKQMEYNKKHHLKAKQITKPLREKLVIRDDEDKILDRILERKSSYNSLLNVSLDELTPLDARKITKKMAMEMRKSASELNFELAAALRDKILEINKAFD